MKHIKKLPLLFAILFFTAISYGATATVTRGLIGEQDINRYTGTGSPTFTRPSSTGGTLTLNKVGYEVDALISYGGGTSYTQATIEAALTAIKTPALGGVNCTLLLRPGTWVISSNANWSAYTNVTFKIVPGAVISHGAFTVNIPNLDAGLYQVFSGSGTITLSNVTGIRPEWWGAKADDSTDCTAAFASTNQSATAGLVSYGPKKNILLSTGTYRVTATSGNYAVTVGTGMVGEGPDVSIIKNVGTGSALKIVGVDGEIYFSHFRDFSVTGNASSEDGIVLNPANGLNTAVGYSWVENVDSSNNGRHGLVHTGSWGTKYDKCKFKYNKGLGVYLVQVSADNNIIFTNCDARWNGGTTDWTGNPNELLHGGVRFSGTSSGVYWIGGVVESNNAWAFIVGETVSAGLADRVIIKNVWSEPGGGPSTTSGFLRLSSNWSMVEVRDSIINLNSGQYGFYITDPVQNIYGGPLFEESGNVINGGIRDYQMNYVRKAGSGKELIDLAVNRDFSGAGGWTNVDFTTFSIATGKLVVAGDTQKAYLLGSAINNGFGLQYGKRYAIKADVSGVTGRIRFASIAAAVQLKNLANLIGYYEEFTWTETNASNTGALYIVSSDVGGATLDNVSIVELEAGDSPQTKQNGLISVSTVPLNANNAGLTLYTVPTGKRLVMTHAVMVSGGDAGATTTITIGKSTALTDFLGTQTLSNLDAQYDSVILQPVPNATPVKVKSYAAGDIIQAVIANQSGDADSATTVLYLYGLVY